jgi:hypothetical protein
MTTPAGAFLSGLPCVPPLRSWPVQSRGAAGLSYVVGDVTRLPSADLGTFDFFLDIGCFQGLDGGQRLAEGGDSTSSAASPLW